MKAHSGKNHPSGSQVAPCCVDHQGAALALPWHVRSTPSGQRMEAGSVSPPQMMRCVCLCRWFGEVK